MARHHAEQPPRAYSRLGLFVAIVLVLAGVGSLALGVLPAEWRQQAATYAGDAWQSLQALGDRLVPLTIGAVCVLLGLVTLVLVIRRGRKRARRRKVISIAESRFGTGGLAYTPASFIPPATVYLDFENQVIGAELVTSFVRLLRESIVETTGGERADLFLYCDASIHARHPSYQELQQYGFRAMDVPHTRTNEAAVRRGEAGVTNENLKNVVDFEISLQACQRALVSTSPQHIYLITADKDFIPLVRNLRSLGHHVHVWARRLDRAFTRLESTLGVDVRSLEDDLALPRITPELPASAVPASATRIPSQATKPRANHVHAGSGRPTGPKALERAIASTLENIAKTNKRLQSNPKPTVSAEGMLVTNVGGMQVPWGSRNLLALLGYEDAVQKNRNRVLFWLDELRALSVLADGSGPLPIQGPTDPDEGAALLYGFLQRDIADALASWQQSGRAGNPFNAVCEYVVSREGDSEPQPIRNLRHLLDNDASGYYLRHAQYLCQCARSLGLTEVDLKAAAPPDESAAVPVSAPPPGEIQP